MIECVEILPNAESLRADTAVQHAQPLERRVERLVPPVPPRRDAGRRLSCHWALGVWLRSAEVVAVEAAA